MIDRPWLFQLGPMFVSDEGRQELATIAVGMTEEEFRDKVWGLRGDTVPRAGDGWPMKACSLAAPPLNANVTQIKGRAARG